MLFRKSVVLRIFVLLILILNGCEVAFYNPFEKDTYNPKDAPKDITSFIFELSQNTGFLVGTTDAIGTIGTNSVNVTVPYGSDVSELIPTITISDTATAISPVTAQDFSTGPVNYRVTGIDGSTKTYGVTVNVALNSSKDISYFAFTKADNLGVLDALPSDAVGTITDSNINVTFPVHVDTSSLIPTISITGESVNLASGASRAFSDGLGVTYTVTAFDSTTQDYSVTVYNPPEVTNGTLTFTGVGINSITVNWNKATDDQTLQDNLEYLVYYSETGNIDTVYNIEHNPGVTLVGTFPGTSTSAAVTPLTEAKTYYFNVIVRDQNLNKTAYTMASQSTLDGTPPTPGNSGTLTFSGITVDSITVNWTLGTDNKDTGNLLYQLYYSTTNTIGTVGTITSGTAVGTGPETNITTKTVSTLNSYTQYYFNVLVQDQAGNTAVFAMTARYTLDGSAPTPGNSGTLTFSGITADSITVNWTLGTDNKDTGNLLYQLYYSTTNTIGTVGTITSGTAVGTGPETNITTKTVSTLNSYTQYYFNVLVQDQAGNTAVFVMTARYTLDGTPPTPGNSGTLTFSGITADSITVNWTLGTDNKDTGNLLYQLYYSTTNTIGTVGTITSGTAVGTGPETNITTKTVSTLNSYTQYYFNVLVQDQAGNTAVYAMTAQYTLDGTPPVPGNGGTLTLGGSTSNSITVNWTLGTDNKPGNLKYQLYYSSNSDIATVGDIVTLGHGNDVGSLTENDSTETASLTPGTYYFNVLIEDQSGNHAVYTMTSFSTLDSSAPSAGNSGILAFSAMGSTSVTVNWTKAADDVTPQENLEYCLYYSSTHILTSLSDIDTYGTASGTFTADIDLKTIPSGLSPSTLYYFNVVVRDQASPTKNRTAYAGTSRMTLPGNTIPPTSSSAKITTAYPFTNPYRMAYYDGYIYVTDRFNGQIVKFDPSNGDGNNLFSATNPAGICTDGTYIYMGEATGSYSGNIRRYFLSGASAGSTSLSSDFYGLAFDGIYPDGTYPDGATYYFVTFNASEKSIERITDYWGRYNFVTIDDTSLMMDLCTDGVNVYVSDSSANRILKIDRGTKAVTTLYNLSSSPLGIETDGTYVYVAMTGGATVKILISDGSKTDMPAIPDVNDFVYDGTYLYAAVGGVLPGIYKLN